MLVQEIMTRQPITIRPDSDVLAAIAIMRAGHFRRLPVIDAQGALVGIVTDDDLLAVSPDGSSQRGLQTKESAIQGDGVLTRVNDVMTADVVSIPPTYPLEEAAQLMVEHRVGCLPVMQEDELVGIVTDTDIFHTLVRVLGGGSDTVRVSVQVDNTPGQFAALAGRIAGIGGNILSIASHPAQTPDRFNLTVRVEGIALPSLLEAISTHPNIEIKHSWDSTPPSTS